ncbi:MAG: hypothetical protein ACYTE3_18465, partial [Planctomycetota bacterium]
LLHFRSVDAQLAAIEATRAIPESENAGAAYTKLTGEYMPLPQYPPVVGKQVLILTAGEPWLGKDYPKLVAWLDERQDLISKLLDISRMEQCRFPIPSGRRQISHFSNPVRHMRGWAHLLIRSANNDAAESRIDAAIEKYVCVLRMGSHLYQQPVLGYYNNGVAKELLALDVLKEFINRNELTEEQLTAIEAVLLPPENTWKRDSRQVVKTQKLIQRKERPKLTLTGWRRYWEHRKVTNKSDGYLLDVTDKSHVRTLASRRTVHILIALRRFKNKIGHWPQSLDRIRPSLSKETLTDPRDNTPFVYELTGKNFKLNSQGAS